MSLSPRLNSKDNLVEISPCAAQNQKAVTAYFSSGQSLPFEFAEHRGRQRGQIRKDKLGDRCLGFLLSLWWQARKQSSVIAHRMLPKSFPSGLATLQLLEWHHLYSKTGVYLLIFLSPMITRGTIVYSLIRTGMAHWISSSKWRKTKLLCLHIRFQENFTH